MKIEEAIDVRTQNGTRETLMQYAAMKYANYRDAWRQIFALDEAFTSKRDIHDPKNPYDPFTGAEKLEIAGGWKVGVLSITLSKYRYPVDPTEAYELKAVLDLELWQEPPRGKVVRVQLKKQNADN